MISLVENRESLSGIHIENISKSFPSGDVLENIDVKIRKGECVAIIGKSGIGKSVLLKHIIGLIRPDTGTIFIDDKDINKISFKELQELRASIGMVFQFGALFDSMNVKENIGLALYKLSNLSRELIDKRIKDVLDAVHMSGTEKLMPSELSGGMKKRIGVARAIALNPAYLLYDEPTTGLDPIITRNINVLIKEIHDRGNITSIIVTHELKTVYEVVDRVIMLHERRIIFDDTPDALINSKELIVQEFIS